MRRAGPERSSVKKASSGVSVRMIVRLPGCRPPETVGCGHLVSRLAEPMGSWYWIGLATGIGVGAGIAIGALLPEGRRGVVAGLAAVLGVAARIGIRQLLRGSGQAGRCGSR